MKRKSTITALLNLKLFQGAIVLLFASLCNIQANAQQFLGSIKGEVSDPTGARVAGATVVAQDMTTNFKTTAKANATGTYALPSLTPDTYTVTLTAPGFKQSVRKDIVLTAGQAQQVDFVLALGDSTESVNVSADNALLDTTSANLETTLTTKEVTDLPNLGRNPYVLATLGAGIESNAYMQTLASGFTNPFSGVAVQIEADGNSGHNRLTLDGIPNDPAERFSGANYVGFVPSPEAVQEVKVSTSLFDAAVGHGNGTVTDVIVRSGTNKIHGAAYYVFQNTYLDANNYQNAGRNAARNNNQVNQTGFVVDGPVLLPKLYDGRNKTFFMVAFERYQSHLSEPYSARSPTAAERAGDFSGLCSVFNPAGLCTSGVQLYDPLSPVDASGNRTVYFPNNNIASRINPAGAALLSYVPLPNVAGAPITSAANYISNDTSYPNTDPSLIVRIDQAVTPKNKLNAIYFQNGLTQTKPHQGFVNGVGSYHVTRDNRGGSLDDVQQFSSSLVLDSRLGLIYHPFNLVYRENTGVDLSSIGITNNAFPNASFPGYTSTDSYAAFAASATGQVSEDTVGSLNEILTKIIGTHILRIGFEGNLTRYNVQNPQTGFGAFAFDRRFTQQNSAIAKVGSEANSGDPIASLLLGYPSSATYTVSAAFALQQLYMAPYFQDDWRLTPKLTLNLGIRYDYESPFTERYNKQVTNFCTTCSNPLQAAVPSVPLNGGLQFTGPNNRFPYPRDLNNIQPRIGAAYNVFPTTVFRAGFGIIYFNTLETPIGTGFSQTTSYNNYVTSAPVNSLSNPFPAGVLLPTGSSLGLSTALGQAITFVDPHHVQPKSAQYSASVQQQFPGNLSLQIAYVGTRPTRLEVNHNINVLPAQYYNLGAAEVTYLNAAVPNPLAGQIPLSTTLNAATIARNLLLLPYPEFGSVTEDYSSIGSAPYNALQIQVKRPMRNHFSLQGSFTWDKTMLHTSFLNSYDTHLASIQGTNASLFGTIFGIYQLPKLADRPAYQRLLLGGWQINGVLRAQNGSMVSSPGSVNIIGNVAQPNPTYGRYINTCYENTSGVPVASTPTVPGCDALSPMPAYQQRLSYTTQTNSTNLGIRQRIHPLADASLFKQFTLHEGVNFEIRGEFFNVLNTPNFGAPGTSLGSATFGVVTLNQANDPRIGQLTARLNF
jgi:hypothetical protein